MGIDGLHTFLKKKKYYWSHQHIYVGQSNHCHWFVLLVCGISINLCENIQLINSHLRLYKGSIAVAYKLARDEDTNWFVYYIIDFRNSKESIQQSLNRGKLFSLIYSHIDYCINLVKLLLSHKIKPILVFHGQSLPAKAAVNAKRQEWDEWKWFLWNLLDWMNSILLLCSICVFLFLFFLKKGTWIGQAESHCIGAPKKIWRGKKVLQKMY